MVTGNTQLLAEIGPIDPRTGSPVWCGNVTGHGLELAMESQDGIAPVDTDSGESGPLHGIARFPRKACYMSTESHLRTEIGQDEAQIRVVLVLEAGSSGEQTPPDVQLTSGSLAPMPLNAAGSAGEIGVEAPPPVVRVTSTRPRPEPDRGRTRELSMSSADNSRRATPHRDSAHPIHTETRGTP